MIVYYDFSVAHLSLKKVLVLESPTAIINPTFF